MQGEYSIPASTPLPSSAADLTLSGNDGSGASAAPPGRWRVQVSVPAAELQEIVPAARLLQSATSLSPAEYARAKAAFLQVRLGGRVMEGATSQSRLYACAGRLAIDTCKLLRRGWVLYWY